MQQTPIYEQKTRREKKSFIELRYYIIGSRANAFSISFGIDLSGTIIKK
ncbi:MAG: hypothetical protein ACPKM0_12580 [Pleomorphochaeta sp.]